jgi:putative N6-adenine-specific DNA methylase
MRLPSAMRLKESRRVPMWNGPIECRLFRFDLVAGSARERSSTSTRGAGERDGGKRDRDSG